MERMIEYYYSLASPWSYLGNDQLREIAARYELTIDPIIIDYERMFETVGTVPLPNRPPLRKAYRLVELKRWSELRGIPLNPEPRFYRGEIEEPNERQAALMVTAAKHDGLDSLQFAHAISRALWTEERYPFTPEVLLEIATAEGFDGSALRAAAATPEIACLYSKQTDRAIARGAFGMPFYIFADEPFWGQDRLDLLDRALAHARD